MRGTLSTPPTHPALDAGGAQRANAGAPPVIDEVIVEKPALCVGEETWVTVRAHTVDHADDELHYTIGPATGARVALRAWVDEHGKPLPYDVTAFGRGNAATTVRVPPFVIKPCVAEERVVVTHRLMANTFGLFEFQARMVVTTADRGDGSTPPSFVPAAYRWTLSDGTMLDTTTPTLRHSFEDRPQPSLYSQISVRVVVTSREGRSLSGSDALQLLNPAYESLKRKRIVMLLVALDPRFPALDSHSVVDQGVTLWHLAPSPVSIQKIDVVSYYAAGTGESPARQEDVAALLGKDRIWPQERLRFRVALDTRAHPDVIAMTYYLEGTSDGLPVRGSFSVMRPPPPPTKENSAPIDDAVLVGKIKAAREILGQDVVSDEDIWRLEREGKLSGTPPAQSPAPSSKPRPVVPLGTAMIRGVGNPPGARPTLAAPSPDPGLPPRPPQAPAH